MGISYRQNPGDVPGMLIATDDDTGQTFPVYDPDMAARLAAGQNPTPEQQQRAADASPMAATPQVADVLKNPTPQAPAPPPQPAPQPQAPEAPLRPNGPNPYDALNQLPQAPGGMVTSKVQVTPDQPGMPYDKVAEEQRGSDLLDRQLALQQQNDQQDMVRDEQKIELGRQREEAKQNADQEQAKADRYTKELQTTVDREINPNRLKENQTLWGSIQGIIGATLAALSSDPNAFGQYTSMMNRRTERDIEAQREQKNSAIDRLTKGLGSAQQAESHYRAKVGELGLQTMTAKLEQLGVREKFEDKLEAERKTVAGLNEAARAASFGKPGAVSVEFGQPAPVKGGTGPAKIALNNPTTKQLEGLGISTKAWSDGLETKVMSGENAPTIYLAANATKQIDSDIQTLESIKQANNGTLPTTGVINVPQAAVPILSRMGWKPGMSAEETMQLMSGYYNEVARSFGGAITDSDRESAKLQFGSSGEGFVRGLTRMRDKSNNGIRAGLAKVFPGVEQQAFDVLLGRTAVTSGVPKVQGVSDFEVQSAPPVARRDGEEVDPQRKVGAYNAQPKKEETPEEKRKREERERRRKEAEQLMSDNNNADRYGYGR